MSQSLYAYVWKLYKAHKIAQKRRTKEGRSEKMPRYSSKWISYNRCQLWVDWIYVWVRLLLIYVHIQCSPSSEGVEVERAAYLMGFKGRARKWPSAFKNVLQIRNCSISSEVRLVYYSADDCIEWIDGRRIRGSDTGDLSHLIYEMAKYFRIFIVPEDSAAQSLRFILAQMCHFHTSVWQYFFYSPPYASSSLPGFTKLYRRGSSLVSVYFILLPQIIGFERRTPLKHPRGHEWLASKRCQKPLSLN